MTDRERLSQPEPKPVAWLSKTYGDDNQDLGFTLWRKDVGEGCFPVYAAPPKREWVDLTKEECWGLLTEHKEKPFSLLVAIQEKLKEKNGG